MPLPCSQLKAIEPFTGVFSNKSLSVSLSVIVAFSPVFRFGIVSVLTNVI
ncbi:MAG: hypothetical protein BWY67_01587 [Bacteroidetes bacterium ADurb.Bin397]|nr:MAG: hypothetical protein BWY67_01587 [Bacteroidetes bacterium ADurb.Bin397]